MRVELRNRGFKVHAMRWEIPQWTQREWQREREYVVVIRHVAMQQQATQCQAPVRASAKVSISKSE